MYGIEKLSRGSSDSALSASQKRQGRLVNHPDQARRIDREHHQGRSVDRSFAEAIPVTGASADLVEINGVISPYFEGFGGIIHDSLAFQFVFPVVFPMVISTTGP
jgi:hypothetical protein